MSSVGVFRKVEMDEKSYLVYTLTQKENTNTNSSGDDLLVQPLFFCPSSRIKFGESQLREDNADDDVYEDHPANYSPHFHRARSGGKSLLDCDHDGICKLPLVHLKHVDDEFNCDLCFGREVSTSYYACLECKKKFHKECVESPLEIRHPLHHFHSLRLFSNRVFNKICISCKKVIYRSLAYRCTCSEAFMHPVCARRPIPFVEDHPKTHPHPLTFFPMQASLACHICGLINNHDPTYICVQCVFVIHKKCIGFPHVIRICRHKHRISFTSSLPPGKLSCGVCHQQVDNNYGAYRSCSKGDEADYFVHSKCALHRNVWDGKVLDEVPEEDDLIDDGEPFMRISDGIILHPFHSHNLRLGKIIYKAYEENKYCRGCSLPIYQGQIYSCTAMECDFILHESCANAPRMKRHPLHPHPLTLKFTTIGAGANVDTFRCSVCSYDGTGFFYEHKKGKETLRLDLRCASITEPFQYEGHKHPLFLPLERMKAPCQTCKCQSYDWKINHCIECDYIICFRCATLPYKVRYKHDKHFLTICDGKEASDQPDWCEICEGKIEAIDEGKYTYGNRTKVLRFYKCDDCCTTLHVECLLGVNIYMRPAGNTTNDYVYFTKWSDESECTIGIKVRILLNNSLTRPVCTGCKRRCPFPIFFKVCGYTIYVKGYDYNSIFCYWDCIGYAIW